MPPPNVGPYVDSLKIAPLGSATGLLNAGIPSLLRREKMNALLVVAPPQQDSEIQENEIFVSTFYNNKRLCSLHADVSYIFPN